MPFIDKSPLSYQPNATVSLRRYKDVRPPTSADYRNFIIGDEWLDTSSSDWWKLCDKDTTSGTWRKMAGTAAASETFTGDSGGTVGPDGLNNINFLANSAGFENGIQFTGTPGNNTITAKNLRNATNYVVDQNAGETEYQTIQAAIDAADIAGGNAIVFVRPGTYSENLTLKANIHIHGDSLSSVIIGNHIPPSTGSVSLNNVFLMAVAGDILTSPAAGTGIILIASSVTAVTNGYTFNLPNWVGTVAYGNTIESITSVNNGFVNNTGGMRFIVASSIGGAGTANMGTFSNGQLEMFSSSINCPITFGGTGIIDINGGSDLHNLTTADTATVSVINTKIFSGANISITHNSSNLLSLSIVSIDSTAVPDVITGTGPIKFGDIVFVQNAGINAGVVQEAVTYQKGGPTEITPTDPTVPTNDAWLTRSIPGAQTYSSGIDNSDTDSFKMTDGADPSTGNVLWKMTAAGERTIPLQPAFYAFKTVTASNVTGDGTNYVVVGFTERFDRGNNFDPVTGLFTAPVPGIYYFHASFSVQDLTAAHTAGRFFIRVGATQREFSNSNVGAQESSTNDYTVSGGLLIDMNQGDTADMNLTVSAGALVADVQDSITAFQGWLVV